MKSFLSCTFGKVCNDIPGTCIVLQMILVVALLVLGVAVEAGRAYLARRDDGVQIVDVAQPARPRPLAVTMAEHLHGVGYQTAVIVSNPYSASMSHIAGGIHRVVFLHLHVHLAPLVD